MIRSKPCSSLRIILRIRRRRRVQWALPAAEVYTRIHQRNCDPEDRNAADPHCAARDCSLIACVRHRRGRQRRLDALSSKDAAAGLRAALSQGIDVAVAQLGAPGGFLHDPKVAIPLPHPLDKAEKPLRMLGMGSPGGPAEGHHEPRRRGGGGAGEAGVQTGAAAHDASQTPRTSSPAATAPARHTSARRRARSLTAKFKPIVAAETAKLGLAAKYDEYAGQASQLGLLPAQDANLNDYVTAKALDGLFSRIAEEEHEIRKDPMGQASSIIKKVFGPL